jgi:methylated-DNA-[protein]-cysteine S-methyltransferase
MMRDKAARISLTIEAVDTPIGGLLLVCDGDGVLRAADFDDCEERLYRLLGRRLGLSSFELLPGMIPDPVKTEVAAYFAGDLAATGRITLKTDGTAFQDGVWNALREMAPGQPVTYAELANDLGRSGATRAVGHANAANPFCVVVPCHRLVGAGGALTGYSGGLQRKRWLLAHEAWHNALT